MPPTVEGKKINPEQLEERLIDEEYQGLENEARKKKRNEEKLKERVGSAEDDVKEDEGDETDSDEDIEENTKENTKEIKGSDKVGVKEERVNTEDEPSLEEKLEEFRRKYSNEGAREMRSKRKKGGGKEENKKEETKSEEVKSEEKVDLVEEVKETENKSGDADGVMVNGKTVEAIQKVAGVEGEEEKKRKRAYLAGDFVNDLRKLYMKGGETPERLKEKSNVGKRFREEGVGTFMIDGDTGMALATSLGEFMAMESGVPENWQKTQEILEKAGIERDDLEEARRIGRRDSEDASKIDTKKSQKKKEKKERDESVVWYETVAGDLYNVTRERRVYKKELKDRGYKDETEDSYREAVNISWGKLEKRIPDIRKRVKESNKNAEIYWASKILGGEKVIDENGKRINSWTDEVKAEEYVREKLGIAKGGVDRVKNDSETKEVSVDEGKKREGEKEENNGELKSDNMETAERWTRVKIQLEELMPSQNLNLIEEKLEAQSEALRIDNEKYIEATLRLLKDKDLRSKYQKMWVNYAVPLLEALKIKYES